MSTALGDLPAQTSTHRKVHLCYEAIELFDKAQVQILCCLLSPHHLSCLQLWERSICVCEKLSDAFRNVLFDLPRLGAFLNRQAQYYELIKKTDRAFPLFFRVAFYGTQFDEDVRNQVRRCLSRMIVSNPAATSGRNLSTALAEALSLRAPMSSQPAFGRCIPTPRS